MILLAVCWLVPDILFMVPALGTENYWIPMQPPMSAHHKDPGCFQTPVTVSMEVLSEPKEWCFLFRRCATDHRAGHKCLFISVPNLGVSEAATSEVMTPSACTLPGQGGRDQRCLCLLVRGCSLPGAHHPWPCMPASSSLPSQQLPALPAQHTEEGQQAALALQALPRLLLY